VTAEKKQTRKTAARKNSSRPWSQHVTETSDALDLKKGVFALSSPHAIALSLRRSAKKSHRRKSDPYRSAMSMLTFYINRAGKKLPKRRRAILESAKKELRTLARRQRSSKTASEKSNASSHRERA
jgi:hypothetical protein